MSSAIYYLTKSSLVNAAKTPAILEELQGERCFENGVTDWPKAMHVKIDFDDTTGKSGIQYLLTETASTPFLQSGYSNSGFFASLALIRSLGTLISIPIVMYEIKTRDIIDIHGHDHLSKLTAHCDSSLHHILWPWKFYITCSVEDQVHYLRYYVTEDFTKEAPFLVMTNKEPNFQDIVDSLTVSSNTD
jgi:hypothetical protein